MPTTARTLPGSQAEALALIRHISERMERAEPGTFISPTTMDIIAAHAMQPLGTTEFINEANFLTIPALSGFIPVLRYKVPDRNVGILEGFTNGVSDWLQFDFVQWQVRVNDGSIPGYDIVGGPIGLFPDVIQRIFHPLFHGNVVTVLANNIATIPMVTICAKITGRVFPDTMPTRAA